MNKIFLFTGVFLCLFLSGCSNANRVYKEFKEIPGNRWDRNYALPFSFEITDTTVAYQIRIHIRHSNAYLHATLPVLLTLQDVSGQITQVPAEIYLKDEKGRFKGDAAGDIWDFCCFIAIEKQKLKKGVYKATLQNTYELPVLLDVMGAGIEVSKTE
ncbi:MAG: gliding motility lipoprotein GldH [Bacteroidia bacterium]|nr:gliding motility lipoprotein GldH [Bacteroidia bacterium]